MTDMVTPGIIPSASRNFLVGPSVLQAIILASLPDDNIVKGILLTPYLE
jgi:hypothetical protein